MPRVLSLAAVLACGCGAQFKPETLVDAMRVLSLVAEPPEIAPGGQAMLSALELDPSRPGGVTTIIWLGCDADPVDFNRSTCADVSALLRPSSFADYPPDMHLLGFGPTAGYSAASTLFDKLPAGDTVRVNGTSGPVVVVVVGAEVKPVMAIEDLRVLFGQMERQEVPSVLALTRVNVSERATRNTNPHLSQVTVDGAALPSGAKLQVKAAAHVRLHLDADASQREAYTLVLPSGPETHTEKLVAAWYSTAGRFTVPRVDLDSGADSDFIAPGTTDDDAVPAKRRGTVWAVLRDDRGGESYETYPFYVCDDSAAPRVSAVTLPTQPGALVEVSGEALDSVLDIVIGGAALEHSGYEAARGLFTGDLPPLAPGSYPVRVRAKNCTDVDTGLTATVH